MPRSFLIDGPFMMSNVTEERVEKLRSIPPIMVIRTREPGETMRDRPTEIGKLIVQAGLQQVSCEKCGHLLEAFTKPDSSSTAGGWVCEECGGAVCRDVEPKN